MKFAKLSVLSAAIIVASSAQASFLEDSTFDLELRNVAISTDKDGVVDASASQWAQGVYANFSSAYFQNVIGFDLGAYYSLKATSSIDQFADSPDLLNGEDSYGKTSYAVKLNLSDMGVAKYGRMHIDTALYNNADDRVLPGLSEGFYADLSLMGLNTYALWINKSNGVTSSGFEDFNEPVQALGAMYEFDNGLMLSGDLAMQSDHADKYLGEVSYDAMMGQVGISAAGQYALVESVSDEDVDYYGLKFETMVSHATFGATYTKVGEYTGADTWGWKGGDNDTQFFGYNVSQISDFNKSDQEAIGIHAAYDFSSMIDGLSIKGAYVMGEDGSLDETEYNVGVNYAFPQMKGLSAELMYAENTAERPNADDLVKNEILFTVNYTLPVM